RLGKSQRLRHLWLLHRLQHTHHIAHVHLIQPLHDAPILRLVDHSGISHVGGEKQQIHAPPVASRHRYTLPHPTFLSMIFFRKSSGLAPDSNALASVRTVGSANVRMRFDSRIFSRCATSLIKSFVSLSTQTNVFCRRMVLYLLYHDTW